MAEPGWMAAVLAGGAGTRFWPASRRDRPKPFIQLLGDTPLIRLTADRLEPVVGAEGTFYVVGERLARLTRDVVPQGQAARIVAEPLPRNTLGAVLLAMGHALSVHDDPKLAVFPSDHLIGDVEVFQRTLRCAFQLADRHVIAMGIVPTHPETGYGYIKAGAPWAGTVPSCGQSLPHPLVVDRFVEKPDLDTARSFLAEGSYLWNAGIFVLPVNHFLEHLSTIDPHYRRVVLETRDLYRCCGNDLSARLGALLTPLPNLNIDRGAMETCPDMLVLPAGFPWSDVGSWDALFDGVPEGESRVVGEAVQWDCRNNVVVQTAGAPLVTCVGVEDLIVVATPDAVLVTRRGQGQKVGELVKELQERGRTDVL